MTIPRKLGALVVFGVPAIIGGGVVFVVFQHDWFSVLAFELLLVATAGALVSR